MQNPSSGQGQRKKNTVDIQLQNPQNNSSELQSPVKKRNSDLQTNSSKRNEINQGTKFQSSNSIYLEQMDLKNPTKKSESNFVGKSVINSIYNLNKTGTNTKGNYFYYPRYGRKE